MRRGRGGLAESAVRPVLVVMALVPTKHDGGVPLVDDQEAVEEFAAEVPTKRSVMALARGARTGVLMIWTLGRGRGSGT